MCGCGPGRCNQTAEGDDLIHVHCARKSPLAVHLATVLGHPDGPTWGMASYPERLVNKTAPPATRQRDAGCIVSVAESPAVIHDVKVLRYEGVTALFIWNHCVFPEKSHASCSSMWCGSGRGWVGVEWGGLGGTMVTQGPQRIMREPGGDPRVRLPLPGDGEHNAGPGCH